jgi:hypothetical protein
MKACQGSFLNQLCDGEGILPFDCAPGCVVMLCRLCHYHETVAYERARDLAIRRATDEMYRKQYGSEKSA